MDGQQAGNAGLTPPLLDGWLPRDRVAAEIGVSANTLARWQRRRIGPPCAKLGRKVLYRADALREWLRSCEGTPVKKSSRGRPRTRRGHR
jgi:hypothetical protein